MTRWAKLGAWLIGALVLLTSGPALAQMTKRECIDANTKGQNYRREGKLADARRELRACSASACPSLVSADCVKRLDELESVQPTVVFNVVDGAGRDLNAVTVTVNGKVLVDKLDGVAIEVEPGEHELTFSAEGRTSVTETVVFREGEKSRVVRITMKHPDDVPAESHAAGPSAANTLAPPRSVDAERSSSGSTQRTIGLIVGGAGLVSMGAGGFFGYQTIQSKNRQVEQCESTSSCRDRAAAADAHEDAKKSGLISTITFIAGGAATAAGLVLVFTAGSGKDEPAVAIAPGIGPNGPSLRLRAAF
jgi:hypothetical protein